MKLEDITDGLNTTLLLIEAPLDRAVPWMSPHDADESLFKDLSSRSKLAHSGGFNCIMADGSGRFISIDVDRDILRALTTAAANDPLKTTSD